MNVHYVYFNFDVAIDHEVSDKRKKRCLIYQ
jgi:hypothetical protein